LKRNRKGAKGKEVKGRKKERPGHVLKEGRGKISPPQRAEDRGMPKGKASPNEETASRRVLAGEKTLCAVGFQKKKKNNPVYTVL